jgi:lactobin A/cerein 7B family class IIb bacteriocin
MPGRGFLPLTVWIVKRIGCQLAAACEGISECCALLVDAVSSQELTMDGSIDISVRQGVRELSLHEIDEVSGGVAPLVIAGVAAGGLALGVGVGFAVVWLANKLF